MQPAIMDLLSSISEFFVGQRHQLVQSLPSYIVIVLISTSTASALLVHRKHPTFDLIAVEDQQLTSQQQCTTQKKLRAQACHAACYHGPVFIDTWVLRRSAAAVGAVSTLFFLPSLLFRPLPRQLILFIVITPLSISSKSKNSS